MFSLARIAAAGAAAVALTVAGTAAAQQPANAGAQIEIAPVTDAEIETFVAATKEIVPIIEKWQPKLQAAETEEAAQALQRQAQAELVAAVEASGMSADRYNQINTAAGQDAELAARIRAEMGAA